MYTYHFRSGVRSRHATDRQTDRHRGSFYNAPSLRSGGHNNRRSSHSFSPSMPLVGRQERCPACKNYRLGNPERFPFKRLLVTQSNWKLFCIQWRRYVLMKTAVVVPCCRRWSSGIFHGECSAWSCWDVRIHPPNDRCGRTLADCAPSCCPVSTTSRVLPHDMFVTLLPDEYCSCCN